MTRVNNDTEGNLNMDVLKHDASNGDQESLTYLITGGAGFIGSHLSDRLLSKGHRVLSIDNLSTGRLANIEHLLKHERFQFSRADITSEVVLDRLASEADTIIHLAASVGVERIISNPVEPSAELPTVPLPAVLPNDTGPPPP